MRGVYAIEWLDRLEFRDDALLRGEVGNMIAAGNAVVADLNAMLLRCL